MKTKKETIIRTIVTFLVLCNSALSMTGKNPLPWSDEELYSGVSAILAVITTLWSWWKNNSFTAQAQAADTYKEELLLCEHEEEKK